MDTVSVGSLADVRDPVRNGTEPDCLTGGANRPPRLFSLLFLSDGGVSSQSDDLSALSAKRLLPSDSSVRVGG